MSADEYKEVLAFSGKQHLNIFFGQWTISGLIGVATFPWDNDVHGVHGGILVKPDSFGRPNKTDSLVHEIGHALGLWHVHHGVSEMDCSDPCLETTPSLQLGDLCADTNPTVENGHCSDPDRTAAWPCGVARHVDTPYSNYMSYSDDACTDHFSAHQVARMHCYLDLVYQRLQKEKRPSPVPFAPKVVTTGDTSVEVRWLPPLGTAVAVFNEVCGVCGNDNSLLQYAASASVANASRTHGAWAPDQATGPPDAAACEASTKAWMPDEACGDQCYIELGFAYPVVAKRMSVWIVWNAINAIKDVQLMFQDGGSYSIGRIPVYCDMPFTKELKLVRVVDRMRIQVSSPYVSVDAVSLQSAPDSFRCRACRPLSYSVQRQPPFSDDISVSTTEPRFVDRWVVRGETYSYRVQPRLGSKTNYFSEQLVYTHGSHYCGDGRVDSDEACDDANRGGRRRLQYLVSDGEGISLRRIGTTVGGYFDTMANLRPTRLTAGEPSVCYRHDGDGVCEDFERRSSVRDCGFYTPEGYRDQWAVSAVANPAFQLDDCPADVVTGPPPVHLGCSEDFDGHEVWHPCGSWNGEDSFWLQVAFQRPVIATTVIVYLASDGMNAVDPDVKTVSVSLVDTDNVSHSLPPAVVSCRTSPLHVNVMHDLSQPLFKTKAVRIDFRSDHLAISAVALRTSDSFDALEANDCDPDSLYNRHTGRCVPYQCRRPVCRIFMIKFGSAHCAGNKEGDTCSIVCDHGYELASSVDRVRCVNRSWEGVVECAPIDCGDAYIPHARVDCPDGTTYGRRCKFECRSPARKHGSDNVIECQPDGAWSSPHSFCQVVCPRSPRVKNATLVGRQCRVGRLDVGTKCRFRCNPGFHVVGESIKRRLFRQICTDDGAWTGVGCERVECVAPPVVYEGLYSCSDHYFSGSRCTLKCPQPPQPNGPTSTITCLRSGQWSSDFTSCKFPPGQCPTPTDSGDVHYECSATDIGECRDSSGGGALNVIHLIRTYPDNGGHSPAVITVITWRYKAIRTNISLQQNSTV
ncbi:hypothetical protein LSAT2_030188 [Lamellibrachia satsuma]|nr:hypothetical protein LSAT2_030188 [Lamellibrachia satsuma]